MTAAYVRDGIRTPFGASGARMALTALRQLEAPGGQRALATLCIGADQGAARALERA
uniref:Thiolase C-terminal domain-containing protein n=1 Tax=Caulobacter sp. (strain K31) TaxID=366602 RepID=B0SV85_CAUSK